MKILPQVILISAIGALSAQAQGTRQDYERAENIKNVPENSVVRHDVLPHWSKDGESFWYVNSWGDNRKEFVLIDALSGTRKTLAKPPWEVPPKRLPASAKIQSSRGGGRETSLTFNNQTPESIRIFWVDFQGSRKSYGVLNPAAKISLRTFTNHVWLAEGTEGKVLGVWEACEQEAEVIIEHDSIASITPVTQTPAAQDTLKPFLRDNNVWLKDNISGEETPLSAQGTKEDAYEGALMLSPDRTKLLAVQTVPAQDHRVHMVESSPKDQLQPRLLSHSYLKPGDKIAHPRPRLFDLEARKQIPVDEALFPNPWSISNLEWAPDGKSFRFLYNERGHQLMRVLSVDAASGAVRAIIEERSGTFIDYSQKTFLKWLDATNEVLWMSERDGWNHLWLYDVNAARPKRQLTSGHWVVRGVDHVDSNKRQIWFSCAGIYPGQDPYFVHFGRVDFGGSDLVFLTQADGTHASKGGKEPGSAIRFSPDGRWFIATHSRVDLPPVTELRRSSDGKLVCVLEKADASELYSKGWRPPERFVAKGRDGRTDIYGIITRPSNFEPGKKYPVIESIYAGPHGYFVPKEWSPTRRQNSLAELGFIVVQIDGMGTNWRSKAFHDMAWKNLKDAGFPDRIAWMRAAGAKYPEMDLSRVGIYGGSAGGQNALAGLLHHGDFYQVAVADCGCHDNRMDKIWWNEAWMGWPVGAEYSANSNVTHAAKLKGKLLLTVGELDRNVDPASTMQVVNALVAADKDFEFLIIPGADHGAGETRYADRRRMDFFVRHLLGKEPRSDGAH